VGLGDPDAGVPQVRDAGLPGGAADTDSYGYATSRSFDEASAPPNAVPPEVSAAIQMWYNATRPPQSNQELAHSQQKADRIALGAAIGAADQVTLGHFTEALRQVDRAHFRAVWSDPDVALGYLSGVLGTTLAEAWGAAELVVGGGAIAATPDGPPQLLGGAMVVAGVGVGAHAAAGVMANAHNISHAASTVVLAENWGGEGDAPTHQSRRGRGGDNSEPHEERRRHRAQGNNTTANEQGTRQFNQARRDYERRSGRRLTNDQARAAQRRWHDEVTGQRLPPDELRDQADDIFGNAQEGVE